MSTLQRRLKVTHPFHPLFNQEFELVAFINSWKKACVQCIDATGSQLTLPLEWTDAAGVDPFVQFSHGRSYFRFEELLRLTDLLASMSQAAASQRPEDV